MHTLTHTHLVGAEADVAQLQDGGENGPHGGDLVAVETDGLETLDQQQEVLLVLFPLQLTRPPLRDHLWKPCFFANILHYLCTHST